MVWITWWRGTLSDHINLIVGFYFIRVIQPVRLLVSARAYQSANSVFLSQQTSTSRTYQPRNQPTNRLIDGKACKYICKQYMHASSWPEIYCACLDWILFISCGNLILVTYCWNCNTSAVMLLIAKVTWDFTDNYYCISFFCAGSW